MTASLPPQIRFQPLVAGLPLPGGKVYFYQAGTLVPQAAYAADGTTPLANPLTLDANGATDFRLGDLLSYKINVTDSIGTPVTGWPVDQITSQNYNQTLFVLIANLAATGAGQGAAMVGYLAPYTGAVATTQSGLNTDTLALANFAPVGDGVADDTAALTAALAARPVLNLVAGKTYLVAGVSVPAGATINGNGATLKLKPLESLVFTPILAIAGAGVTIKDCKFDGNRTNQPLNAFSDSFDTGANATGKANRSAIRYDGAGVERFGLTVLNCTFTAMYGASIATRDVSNVLVDGCYFHDNNFECVFIYTTIASGLRHSQCKVSNCSAKNIASGDATVNADCFALSSCDYGLVINCSAYNFERDLVKFEACNYSTAIGNTCDTNTLAFFGMQMQSGGIGNKFIDNTLLNTNGGIQVNTGTFTDITIANNIIIPRVSSTGTPDGIQVNTVTRLQITGNILKNICRMGIYPQDCSSVVISDNNLSGYTATSLYSPAIQVTTAAAAQSDCLIANNVINAFHDASAGGQGAITFSGGTYAMSNVVIMGNIIHTMTDTVASRGIFFSGAAVPNLSLINNMVYGMVEVYPTTLVSVGNQIMRQVTGSSMGNIRGQGAAAPVAGAYYQGDCWLHSAPAAAGNMGWVCTAAGSPGTWKTWGAIQA